MLHLLRHSLHRWVLEVLKAGKVSMQARLQKTAYMGAVLSCHAHIPGSAQRAHQAPHQQSHDALGMAAGHSPECTGTQAGGQAKCLSMSLRQPTGGVMLHFCWLDDSACRPLNSNSEAASI